MTAAMQTESWESINWKQIQKNVFRLQKRIYQASKQANQRKMKSLQRLLLRSHSAKLLAVRKVSQDNRGKTTAGIDGKANLKPPERLKLVNSMKLQDKPDPLRRVYIPKANSINEQRPLSIPTMKDRAKQALVKLVLEPEWEAKFEFNSYGFRPGRSTHDAITAVYNNVRHVPKYILDADIEKCFDKICHKAILAKLQAIPTIHQAVKAWLKAGILDKGELLFPEAGAPQGGVVSPLLMNVALHGLESCARLGLSHQGNVKAPKLIRYCDDFVVLHEDLEVIKVVKQKLEAFLADVGLKLKESKTSITHSLHEFESKLGFKFLGFYIRQYPVGKYHRGKVLKGSKRDFKALIKPSQEAQEAHARKLIDVIRKHRSSTPETLINGLNPIVRGWSNYYRAVTASVVFNNLDFQMKRQLIHWVRWRTRGSMVKACDKYFIIPSWRLKADKKSLLFHTDTHIKRFFKVKADASPFDGNTLYWATRLGRSPELSPRKARLLKRQKGKCWHCGLYFSVDDIMELHHLDKNKTNNHAMNLVLVMGHCHDALHRGAHDRS